jgi:glycosyltransferase involved in cell wall biosynthesis
MPFPDATIHQQQPLRLSVVVPTLNEEERLPATLAGVALAPGDELIVIDGGSTDQTVALARQFTP